MNEDDRQKIGYCPLFTLSPAYLERFVRETCRGEAVHWVVFACALLFFLWNPWWIGLIMVAYAAAVNVPCIIAQRYNRIRLVRLSTLCSRRHVR